jgi:hypothetical protein
MGTNEERLTHNALMGETDFEKNLWAYNAKGDVIG